MQSKIGKNKTLIIGSKLKLWRATFEFFIIGISLEKSLLKNPLLSSVDNLINFI